MPAAMCAECRGQGPGGAPACPECGRPVGRPTDTPSAGLAWGSRLVLLLGLAFAVYGTEYGGGMLFSIATGVILLVLVASFWRPRVGVLGAGSLLGLLVLVQVVT